MNLISKSQIDRLGERLKKGDLSDEDLRELDVFRESFASAYSEVITTVRSATGLEPTGRDRKTAFSIVEKLRRQKTMHLSQMQDIAGCRVVVADISEQDKVVERLTRAFAKPPKVFDRRQRPSHGYRAVHIIATVRNKLVEIQVRTELQNLWAQQSEVMADRTDPRIKYGSGDPDALQLLSHNSRWIAELEKEEVDHRRMASTLSDLITSNNKPEELAKVLPRLERQERNLAERKARLVKVMKGLNKVFNDLPKRVN